MHICQQVLQIVIAERLAEPRHLFATQTHDVSDALIVGREPAQRQILILEYPLQTGSLFAARRVGFVAAVAVLIVNFSAGSLLRIQPQLRVRFSPLNIAA